MSIFSNPDIRWDNVRLLAVDDQRGQVALAGFLGIWPDEGIKRSGGAEFSVPETKANPCERCGKLFVSVKKIGQWRRLCGACTGTIDEPLPIKAPVVSRTMSEPVRQGSTWGKLVNSPEAIRKRVANFSAKRAKVTLPPSPISNPDEE